ncbi:MAG: UDP-N-acetylmuramoyl-L-alanyl-D-glutamate--2,6-diaminopimelate ligase [Patescibacteria group bacterium]|jgi:UDP-N-acetylmuramoyl-L-alanyl-D-glutamate--2,6-diaminopimelate ligase
MKSKIKKIIPKFLLQFYHLFLANAGAFFYGYPSRRMVVIGVTGTKGKSTVVNLIAKVLEAAGEKVGLASTMNFKIANKIWENDTKQTMPGRFRLQRLLSQMVKNGCQYAIIETSSEGIAQYRHLGINYDIAVFTNLSPEHIEAHGSFEKYREAKGRLFSRLVFSGRKIIDGKKIKKVIVANIDDQQAGYFLNFKADEKWGYGMAIKGHDNPKAENKVLARDVIVYPNNTSFEVDAQPIELRLLGEFNVYNSLAAITVGYTQGLQLLAMKNALEEVRFMPGRLEEIANNRGFRIFIDYAHEPASLEEVYKTLRSFKPRKIISVLGSQGGGRDKRKRPILGRLAGQYTDLVIITNEDPYDENPQTIIDEVAAGAEASGNKQVGKILDRRTAIVEAIGQARKGDIVIITGKGSETVMAVKNDKKIPWDDRKTVKEILEK